MDLIISGLRIPVEKDGLDECIKEAALKLSLGEENIKVVKILSKTLDIKDREQFYYEMSVVVNTPDNFANKQNFLKYVEQSPQKLSAKSIKDRPIIVGFGPAGMFAALRLIDHGIKPLIFERGRKIEERSRDVQRFIKERVLDPESNIQFGEGGAGSYSDGKLFSRLKNTVLVRNVLDTFIKFGAPREIRYINKPHLGTDVLCKIVVNIRNYILEHGGEIHYSSKMTDLIVSAGKVRAIVINDKTEFSTSLVYLAVGHSSRDTFEMIHKKGITLEQKPISVGVRIEHPAEIINLIRYRYKYKNFAPLGAANYSFTYTDRNPETVIYTDKQTGRRVYNDPRSGRGVYTFCMCPGGEVVNASSQEGLLVLNGMSYSKRASPFSNSAIVVTCRTDDYGSSDPLAGIEFQKQIERRAFKAGGGKWEVPAQNLTDFLAGRVSESLNKNSCKTGTTPADLKEIYPQFVCDELKNAFNKWKEEAPLFVSEHAILLAAETRTTCPLIIKRNENYESINTKNLYPLGEGSGYSGGIMSSVTDAVKAVDASMLEI